MSYKLKETKSALKDPCIHDLTKNILRAAENKDLLDRYHDVQLAADLLKAEMDAVMSKYTNNS